MMSSSPWVFLWLAGLPPRPMVATGHVVSRGFWWVEEELHHPTLCH